MFAPRFLAVCALVAAVAALPTDKPSEKPSLPNPITTINDEEFEDTPWFSFPLFGNLFAPLWRLLPSFGEIGPKIISDSNTFQVVVNVKDYKKDELKVKIKDGFILVQGSHEAKQDDHDIFASQFFHTYTLPTNSSGSDVSAEYTNDGYLIVNAPLNGAVDRAKDADRDVPIVETGAPYQKETTTNIDKTTIQPTTGLSSNDDDRKEPTTPSDREEITEKDNVIPHGNEISL